MEKRGFYVNRDIAGTTQIYTGRTLRNLYIKWNIARYGIPTEIPEGFWLVTLKWHHAIFPSGLRFDEA